MARGCVLCSRSGFRGISGVLGPLGSAGALLVLAPGGAAALGTWALQLVLTPMGALGSGGSGQVGGVVRHWNSIGPGSIGAQRE